jgi:hypothetical protein
MTPIETIVIIIFGVIGIIAVIVDQRNVNPRN